MAKKIVLSVFDSKIGEYNAPFFMRTLGEALRGWESVCNDASTDFHKYPEDYCLMQIADYDDETGNFTNLKAPLNLGLAAQFKKPDTNNVGNMTELKNAFKEISH